MSCKRALALLCLLAALAASGWAKKKKQGGFVNKPGSDAVENFSVVEPAFACSNWAWAAATQSILALDEVQLDQRELIQKIFGGELCLDRGLDLRKMGNAVAGVYVLDAKRKMKVVPRVVPPGAVLTAEELIAAVRRKRPMIVFWKARAYVVVGAAYNEWIGANGTRLWEIRELTLLDPVAQTSVTFDKSRDDARDLSGAMEFSLLPMRELEWVPTVATPRPR